MFVHVITFIRYNYTILFQFQSIAKNAYRLYSNTPNRTRKQLALKVKSKQHWYLIRWYCFDNGVVALVYSVEIGNGFNWWLYVQNNIEYNEMHVNDLCSSVTGVSCISIALTMT